MKQIFTPKILRKILILGFLFAGLAFAISSERTSETAQASLCCRDCPAWDTKEPDLYCEDQCGSMSGYCYNSFLTRAYNCYATCDFCSGGGNPRTCEFDTQCQPGEFCVNNICQSN